MRAFSLVKKLDHKSNDKKFIIMHLQTTKSVFVTDLDWAYTLVFKLFIARLKKKSNSRKNFAV